MSRILFERRVFPLAVLLLFLVISSPRALATGECRTPSFNSPAAFSAGPYPTFVASGDLNGDGALDAVVTNLTSGTFSIMFGDGAGGFLPPRSFDVGINGGTVGAYPRAVAIGDLNGDGKLDLVITGGYNHSWVSLLLGNGAGQFGKALDIATGQSGEASDVALGDFNGDGKKDIVTADSSSRKITFLLGDGAGGVTSFSSVTSTAQPTTLDVGDFNGDAFTDVIAANTYPSPNITVVLGRNDGNFAITQTITPHSEAQDVALADFNGDGKLDLATAFGYADYGVEIRFGDGAGAFGAVANSIATTNLPVRLVATDLNNDGKADILIDLGDSSSVGTLLGNGNGQFALTRYSGTLTGEALGMAVGDFNNDGKKDVVVTNNNAGLIGLLLGDGAGAFVTPMVLANQSDRDVGVVVADFNSDGKPDLATAGGYSASAKIYLNDGQGGLLMPTYFVAGAFAASIATADFNHDGKTDLIIGHDIYANYFTVLLGNGAGAFGSQINTNVGSLANTVISLAVGNFDADNNPDVAIISGSFGASQLSVLHGDGTGNFGALVNIGTAATWIETGDLNGDGKADLVMGTYGAASITVLLGDGLGGFSPASYSPVPLAGGLTSLRLADLDKNGRLDIVVVQTNASQLTVLMSNGAGFDAQKTLSGILAPLAVAIADYNADGNPDLAVTTNSNPGNIAVLAGDGLGNFSAPSYFTAGRASNDIGVGDFNDDGRPDLVTPNFTAILLNTFQVLPCLSVNDVSMNEVDANPVNADFTVTLSSASAQTVRVNYTLVSVTAKGGVDYTNLLDRLVFQPGEVTKTISVPIAGDLVDEADETFKVLLSNPAAAGIADGEGTGTIVDNDPTPTLKVNDITVTEGGNSLFWNFTVTLSAPSGRDVTFQFATADGTATAGTSVNGDYFGSSGTRTITAGETTITIGTTVFGDNTYEPDETFFLNLSSPVNATIEDGQGQAAIPNDDPQPTISIDDKFASEADPNAGSSAFTLRLTNPSYQPISISYATADVTATAGSDYTAVSGTLTFNPGETNKTITVPVLDDSAIESTETFLVNLTNPVNATLTRAQATGSIIDDDTPVFTFAASTYTVSEGSGFATINVIRATGTNSTATVDYGTSDGTAQQRNKYTTAVGTLSFAAGETTKSFTVLVTDTGYVEGTQTVNLTLRNPTGSAVLGTPKTAVLRIIDNDSSPTTSSPLDDAQFFVRQHYYDFLNRIPDQSGFNFWSGQIMQCGSDQNCLRQKRIDVSNAFFYELEYQQTGSYVYRLYRAAFGNNQPAPNPDTSDQTEAKKLPAYSVFAADRSRVVGGSSLAQGQTDFAKTLVQRPEFLMKYPGSLDGPAFVDAVLATISNELGANLNSQRQALIDLFDQGGGGNAGRGNVMYRLADDNAQSNPINNRSFIDAEYNRAFVATQYFGYLRRDPDMGGFLFWLNQVSNAPLHDVSKQHAMVCSFNTSAEYQQRFSLLVTHTNAECQ